MRNLNLQSLFINNLIEHQSPTLVYLQNNICINGFILSQDNKVIVVKDKNGIQVLYKNAISSIVPKETEVEKI